MDSMRGHLVDVCREARDRSGASKTKIAAAINKGEQSVSRFEQGVGGWHTQTGELVAAYAALEGVPPIELWQRAIDLWKASQLQAEGEPPVPAIDRSRRKPPRSTGTGNSATGDQPAKSRRGIGGR